MSARPAPTATTWGLKPQYDLDPNSRYMKSNVIRASALCRGQYDNMDWQFIDDYNVKIAAKIRREILKQEYHNYRRHLKKDRPCCPLVSKKWNIEPTPPAPLKHPRAKVELTRNEKAILRRRAVKRFETIMYRASRWYMILYGFVNPVRCATRALTYARPAMVDESFQLIGISNCQADAEYTYYQLLQVGEFFFAASSFLLIFASSRKRNGLILINIATNIIMSLLIFWAGTWNFRIPRQKEDDFAEDDLIPRSLPLFLVKYLIKSFFEFLTVGVLLFRYYYIMNPYAGRFKLLMGEAGKGRGVVHDDPLKQGYFQKRMYATREAINTMTLDLIRAFRAEGVSAVDLGSEGLLRIMELKFGEFGNIYRFPVMARMDNLNTQNRKIAIDELNAMFMCDNDAEWKEKILHPDIKPRHNMGVPKFFKDLQEGLMTDAERRGEPKPPKGFTSSTNIRKAIKRTKTKEKQFQVPVSASSGGGTKKKKQKQKITKPKKTIHKKKEVPKKKYKQMAITKNKRKSILSKVLSLKR